jgi:hypothetical protein
MLSTTKRTSTRTEQQVEHRRFERTVNYLLSNTTHSKRIVKFTLTTDPGSRVVLPDAKTKLSSSVKTLVRSDGTESRPDAVLTDDAQGLVIVCDAKFYSSDIPEKVILKTLDDMSLRSTEHGLLICS